MRMKDTVVGMIEMIISKRPPYEKTTADPERTEMQINKLLGSYGISKYQWTKDLKAGQVSLTFEVEAEIQGVKKLLAIKIIPPTFAKERHSWNALKGRNEKIYAPNWAQSYRLLFHWLKAKIEAIAYGLTTVEQEFLAQVVTTLPSGEQATIGEILVQRGVLSSGRFELEDQSEHRPYSYAEEQQQ